MKRIGDVNLFIQNILVILTKGLTSKITKIFLFLILRVTKLINPSLAFIIQIDKR